jgi:hypothetical protein
VTANEQEPAKTEGKTDRTSDRTTDANAEFARLAGRRRQGLIFEMQRFLAHHKKWWLLPIFVILLLVGVFVVVGGSSVAPLIYTLF